MPDLELPDRMRQDAQLAWRRYVDLLNPFRPDLHRYCLRLTGDLWDAVDLVQDTIVRGFATLGISSMSSIFAKSVFADAETFAFSTILRRSCTRPACESGSLSFMPAVA